MQVDTESLQGIILIVMKPPNRTETAPIWHLCLFGTLKIQLPDGKKVTFDGKKAGELLAYLALHSNQPCDKSKIAALLWKDSDPISARTRLRQELANLRSLLGIESSDEAAESSLFEITRQTLRLRPECCTTDTQQFQAKLELAAKSAAPRDKLQLLTDALTLSNADLLIEYDDWALPIRAQFLSDREQASHDAATLNQQIETNDALTRLKQETSAEGIGSVQPPSSANVSRNLSPQKFAGAALAVLFLFAMGRYLWRPKATATPLTQSPASPVKAIAPPLEYGKEKWIYTYTPQNGEKPDSEAKAIAVDTDNTLYATGLMHTKNEDADILTVKLSPEGRQLWAKRYSSPEHDCDRAFAITISGNKSVYIAGETFVPASPGVEEGWRLVLICYDKEGKRRWVKRLPMITKNHGHQIKVTPAGDGDAVIAGTGIVNEREQVAVFYCNSNGTVRWQCTVLPKNAQSSVLHGLSAVADYGIVVTGTTLLGEGKNELNTNWMTAKISQQDGKIRWLRTVDGEGHGSDVAETMASDRLDSLWIGGTLSALTTEQNGQYALGVFKYDLDGMRLKRLETPFPKTTPWSYGGMCTSWYEGTTTVAVNRTIENKKTVPMLIQYDWQGVLRYQCDLLASAEYSHLDITSLCNADREGGIVLSGRLSATASTDAGVSQFWTARLNADGSIRRQFCYPNQSQGNILLNGMVGGYVFGQVPLSPENRAFVVFCYPY